MDDDDSDQEFERFLQEDDDSMSTSLQEPSYSSKTSSKATTSKRSSYSASISTASQKKLSSASAVTAAAAALLASSKLQKSSRAAATKKSKGKKKKQTAATAHFSDSEGSPPSYSSQRGSRNDPELDPYAFDLDSSFHLNEEKSSDGAEFQRKKEKKKKSEPKPKESVKREAKASISLEDRVAQILKRTGSTALPPQPIDEDERGEDDGDAKSDRSDESEKAVPRYPQASQTASAPAEKKTVRSSSSSDYEEKRLSLSDSLGMESADFEVGLQAKRKLERSRLSLSSLNSEKFAVNVDALEESELTTKSRYATGNRDDYADDDAEQHDDYGDEDFELDQTTASGMEINPVSAMSESSIGRDLGPESSTSDMETPFVSQFEKMKELFSVDSSFGPATIGIAKGDEREEDTALHPSAEVAADSARENDAFGYEDEEFEVDEGIHGIEARASVEKSEIDIDDKAVDEIEHYGDDEFEQSVGVASDLPALPTPTPAQADVQSALDAVSSINTGDVHGTAYEGVDTAEKLSDEVDQPTQPTTSTRDTQGADAPHIVAVLLESPPTSPPPPPPPDDDEPDDEEFNAFALDTPPILRESVHPVPRPDSVSLVEPKAPPSQHPIDRFQQMQHQVSSLRIVEVPQQQRLSHKSKEGARSTQHKTAAAPIESAPSRLDLEEESKEIDDFLRQSTRFKQDRQQMRMMRASASKESELMLRLQQAQRQILQLKRHIQDTEDSGNSVGERGSAGNSMPVQTDVDFDDDVESTPLHGSRDVEFRRGGASVEVSKEEYERLEKEIKTQDKLIQAYQKENEQLMRQLKRIQQGVNYDVHVQNEELKRQLKAVREQLEETVSAADSGAEFGLLGGKGNMGQYSLAVEARLKAEAHALSLQEELAAARSTHQQKENEMKMALDRLKKAKVELECRYEGIDLEKMAEESVQVKQLQSELDMKKKASEYALVSLQKKLDWYVENQRLLDAQDDEVKRLKVETTQLRSEVQLLRSQLPRGKVYGAQSPLARGSSQQQNQSHHRSAADIRRIQELENRLLEMEEAMRKRHPDSLVNLILASRKAEEDSKIQSMEDEYQRHLKAKEEEIEQIQETNEKKLNSFRQQQEKLVLQFQKRIRELDKLVKKAGSHQNPKTLQKRQINHERDVEDELKRVRNFYAEKIKDVERKWEMKYRSLRKQQYGGTDAPNRDLQSLSYADSTIIITNLQRQLRDKEAEIKKLTDQTQSTREASAVSNDRPAGNNDGVVLGNESQLLLKKNEELHDYTRNVEAQLRASEEARSHLIQTLSSLQTFAVESPNMGSGEERMSDDVGVSPEAENQLRLKIEGDLMATLKSDLESVKKTYQDELTQARQKISSLEDQAREHFDAWGNVQIQLSGHVKEVQRLQQFIREAEQEKRMLQELADRVPFLEGEVIRLHEQLTIPRTPSMIQYRSLEMKVETLTQKHLLREAELKVLLTKAAQSSEFEKLQLERIHQSAIAAKNAEIRHFKKQVWTFRYERFSRVMLE